MANSTQDWISYQCTCGFRLQRVPRSVVSELSRCLGCGRAIVSSSKLRTRGLADVRDLR